MTHIPPFPFEPLTCYINAEYQEKQAEAQCLSHSGRGVDNKKKGCRCIFYFFWSTGTAGTTLQQTRNLLACPFNDFLRHVGSAVCMPVLQGAGKEQFINSVSHHSLICASESEVGTVPALSEHKIPKIDCQFLGNVREM